MQHWLHTLYASMRPKLRSERRLPLTPILGGSNPQLKQETFASEQTWSLRVGDDLAEAMESSNKQEEPACLCREHLSKQGHAK